MAAEQCEVSPLLTSAAVSIFQTLSTYKYTRKIIWNTEIARAVRIQAT